jgi:hypothetical protein
MIKLFTDEEFKKAKSRDRLPLQCSYCKKEFKKVKSQIQAMTKGNCNHTGACCSKICMGFLKTLKNTTIVNCKNCNKEFKKNNSQIKKYPNNFCSSKCSGTYTQTHKTYGTRRSKLEIYLESKLIELYPNLEIHFNRKDTINSELDIYIPSLKLAFELNGIFHYEPVYGQEKLDKILNNDNRKFQACFEKNISLCIIDVSKEKYFKEKLSNKYLDIICKIINDGSCS